jgi:hypothetical protein
MVWFLQGETVSFSIVTAEGWGTIVAALRIIDPAQK